MFWFFALAGVLAVAIVLAIIIGLFSEHKGFRYSRTSTHRERYAGNNRETTTSEKYLCARWCWVIFFGAVLIVFMIPCAIINGNLTAKANDAKNSHAVVVELTAQRDEILNLFQGVVENEDYVELMNAAVPDDILFLRQDPEVSEFLLGRADRLVDINARLFKERRRLLDISRSVCNIVDNPFVPQLPFLRPDCNIQISYLGQ